MNYQLENIKLQFKNIDLQFDHLINQAKKKNHQILAQNFII